MDLRARKSGVAVPLLSGHSFMRLSLPSRKSAVRNDDSICTTLLMVESFSSGKKMASTLPFTSSFLSLPLSMWAIISLPDIWL